MKIYSNSHTSLKDIAELYSEYDAMRPTKADIQKIMIRNMKHIKQNIDTISSYEYELLCLCFDILDISPSANSINLTKICHCILSAINSQLTMRDGMNRLYNKYTNFIRNIKYFTKWNTNRDIRRIDKLLYSRLKKGTFNITFALYDFDVALSEISNNQYNAAYTSILFT